MTCKHRVQVAALVRGAIEALAHLDSAPVHACMDELLVQLWGRVLELAHLVDRSRDDDYRETVDRLRTGMPPGSYPQGCLEAMLQRFLAPSDPQGRACLAHVFFPSVTDDPRPGDPPRICVPAYLLLAAAACLSGGLCGAAGARMRAEMRRLAGFRQSKVRLRPGMALAQAGSGARRAGGARHLRSCHTR
jgi:hypothetical protein